MRSGVFGVIIISCAVFEFQLRAFFNALLRFGFKSDRKTSAPLASDSSAFKVALAEVYEALPSLHEWSSLNMIGRVENLHT